MAGSKRARSAALAMRSSSPPRAAAVERPKQRSPESLLDELKRYVGFTEADAACLRAFHDVAEPSFVAIAQGFYDRTREHEQAHAVFKDEAQIAKLQASLVDWLGRVCRGPYDDGYLAQAMIIGQVHVRIGLPQRYMTAAMALVHLELDRIADRAPAEEAARTRAAITKILHVELAIMLESYAEAAAAKASRGAMSASAMERYASAVDIAKVLIVGVDASGRLILFNREAELVTGFARDEALGMSFTEALLAPDVQAEHGPVVASVIAGGFDARTFMDSAIIDRAKKRRNMRWRFARVPGAGADDTVVVALGVDITDSLIALERGRQQEKLAAVGMLAAGLAHEIRNPLNGAQLHLAFLRRGIRGVDAELEEAAEVVASEIKRLSALVTEFLDFARPHPLRRAAFDLRAVVERARLLVDAEARGTQVEVIADYAPQEVIVECDAAKVEQLTLNLLRNALEALAPEGGGRVVVRVRHKPHVGLIEVEDDGPGLRPDARLFDAFYSTKPGGTGLGLAMVHRIVTDHHGVVDVESGGGLTVFRVELPLNAAG